MRKMIALSGVVVMAAMAMLSGCAETKRVSALEGKVADLSKQVAELKLELRAERVFLEVASAAYLTPGRDGYSVLHSDLGPMTIGLYNIEPYANGSRVTLQFGNLTSATVNGARAKLEWGAIDAKGTPRTDSVRSREVTFSQSLRAGAWTNVPVVLEGVEPKELGFVRVRDVGHRGISLER